jgi:hypothetical protein
MNMAKRRGRRQRMRQGKGERKEGNMKLQETVKKEQRWKQKNMEGK